jgi:inhibitor of KinA sporulation pathway (predicted exonuclease)
MISLIHKVYFERVDAMYHVFVDFEMTCWGKRDRIKGKRLQEIIQIGAAKLNDSFDVIDTFSMYVKPEFMKTLTKTCMELTGIKPENLADAPTLAEALIVFEEWIGTSNVKLYSWGDDDCRQFENECAHKCLYSKRSGCYSRWLNLQNIFMRVYGFSRQLGLINAVQMCGFDFEGKQHRAVYDALNGASVLISMKDENKHRKLKHLFTDVYNCNKPFTSTIGELLGSKLGSIRFAS